MDIFKHVTPGEALAFSAERHNLESEMLQDWLRNRKVKVAGPVSLPDGIVKVKNISGEALSQYGVVGIGSVVLFPVEDDPSFAENVIFNSAAPNDASPFGIVKKPAGTDDIVPVVLSGVTLAKVFVNTLTDRYASPIDDNYDRLNSQESGPAGAEILAPTVFDDYGEQWALVRLCCSEKSGIGSGGAECCDCSDLAEEYCITVSGMGEFPMFRVGSGWCGSWFSPNVITACSDGAYIGAQMDCIDTGWRLLVQLFADPQGLFSLGEATYTAAVGCPPFTMTRGAYSNDASCTWPATIDVDVCAGGGGNVTVDFADGDICKDIATTLTVTGTGFDPNEVANTPLTFNLGAVGVCTLVTGTTQMLITFTTPPTSTGALTLIVENPNGSSTPAVQVATVIDCDTAIWQDTFTDTNGTALTAHTPDVSPGGAGYTVPTNYNGGAASKFKIASNKLGESIGGTDSGAQIRFDPGLTSSRLSIDFTYNNTLSVPFSLIIGAKLGSLTTGEIGGGAYIIYDAGDSSVHIGAYDSGGYTDDTVTLTNGVTYTLVVEVTETNVTASCFAVTVSYDTTENAGNTKWGIWVDMADLEPANSYQFDNLEVTPWA